MKLQLVATENGRTVKLGLILKSCGPTQITYKGCGSKCFKCKHYMSTSESWGPMGRCPKSLKPSKYFPVVYFDPTAFLKKVKKSYLPLLVSIEQPPEVGVEVGNTLEKDSQWQS